MVSFVEDLYPYPQFFLGLCFFPGAPIIGAQISVNMYCTQCQGPHYHLALSFPSLRAIWGWVKLPRS